MSQQRIKFNNEDITQPNTAVPKLATTSTSDSGRNMVMEMKNKPMGTPWGYDFTWENIPVPEAAKIINHWKDKSSYQIYIINPATGKWENIDFYTTTADLDALTFEEGVECWKSMSFYAGSIGPL